MVAEKVTIETLSWKDGAKAVKWSCDGGMTYDMDECDKLLRGTRITLYIAEDSVEFLEEYTVRSVLTKYCSFIPVEIYLNVIGKEPAKDADGNLMTDENGDPVWEMIPKVDGDGEPVLDENGVIVYNQVGSLIYEKLEEIVLFCLEE